jgi:hypothetical protein
MKDPVNYTMKYIRGLVADGYSYQDAAINFSCRYPKTHAEVLETIGMWPSSEKELRILQTISRF